MEVSEYERGARRPGLDNLIRYLRGVGADLCTLQALLDESSEPLLAAADEVPTEVWLQLRAAFERDFSDQALGRRVRSVLETLGKDAGNLVKDASSTAGDEAEIPVRELLPGRVRSSPEALDPLVRIGNRLGLTEGQLKDNLRAARRDVRDIVNLDSMDRSSKIQGANSRFQGPLFGTLLLEEARRAIPEDAVESLSLADAALASCEKSQPKGPDPQVRVPALAVRGNAKRALARFVEAEADLLEARRVLDRSKLDDLPIAAELDRYLGSLRNDQGKHEDALRHLERAAAFYTLLADREKGARALLLLGIVHHRLHHFEAAISSTEGALELLKDDSSNWLRAYAHFNLALFLHSLGAMDQAEEELDSHLELISAAGESLVFRAGWLRARIMWSREELGKAERLFRETHRVAVERGIPFDTGLVSLELALVHLQKGRTSQVRKLATKALRIFDEQEVDRECRAALDLLAAAARRDSITRKILEQAIAALERAGQDRQPGARA